MPDDHDERGGDEAAMLLAIRRRALTASTYAEWHQVGRDIETLGQKLANATARADRAEARIAHLDKARDAAVRAWKSEHDAADALQAERDTVVRLLGQFVDHEDGPCRFDHHGACQEHGSDEGPCATATARQFLATVRGDAKAPDASPEGLSEPVERSETSGGHREGSNSSAGTAGPSGAQAPADCPSPYRDGTCHHLTCARCKQHTNNSSQGHWWAYCRVTKTKREFHFCCPGDCELERNDTTEDGQHG